MTFVARTTSALALGCLASLTAACFSPSVPVLGDTDGEADDGSGADDMSAVAESGDADDGPNDDGPNDDGSNDDGPNDDGPNDDGPNDDGPNDDGPNDDGPNDDGTDSEGDTGDPCAGACVNGICEADGTCSCDEGFEGDDCSVDTDDCVDADCGNGSCVDQTAGYVCECDEGWEGEACAELQMPLCLRGALTVTDALDVVNGFTATGAFEPYEGNTIQLNIVFDVANDYVGVGGGGGSGPEGQLRTIETAGLSVSSSDDAFTSMLGDAFANSDQEIILVNGPTIGVDLGNMVSPTGAEYWGIETFSDGVAVPLAIDAETGFPALLPSNGSGDGSVALRRYQTGTPLMTDYASATWQPALLNGSACD